ncbi:MAG: V-type ATP synthase subunit A [Sphaerochaetaceae bacterium]|nr:V-type ATP synthase subunit A [Sphaerochaetaceae bacterium]
MPEKIIGQVQRVNGPVITVDNVTDASMMDLVYVGEDHLIGELVKLDGTSATVQVYEDTTGLCPFENVYGTSLPLSVELGPGLIGSIYDGIQRPLSRLREICGDTIAKGVVSKALDRTKKWEFTPVVAVSDTVHPGSVIGTVQETSRILHRILVPLTLGDLKDQFTVVSISDIAEYSVDETVCVVEDDEGERHSLTLMHSWSIRKPRKVKERKPLSIPLITGQRVIDMLFPLAKGGTVAIPGGFGTGKTMTQHAIASWCDADIIVYIGCGERGNEMTDVLREFPKLIDPYTGKSLMERTILIANTSNMPVSAREASIYTGITLAEYYRDQGYHVAVMADSTSRWAEALRELSGRMEEMPAEEGFPAYLPTRIAEFYERAGRMETLSAMEGSVSIIGAVSPPGGDFSEPVTQHTKRFVRCFWGLDRSLASSRHYPAISWLDSYSEYVDEVAPWWEQKGEGNWKSARQEIMNLLQKEVRLQQIVKLVGPDALPDSQNFILEVCSMFKTAFLQQNAFDDIDKYSSIEKQLGMLNVILTYWKVGSAAIEKGLPIVRVKRMKVTQEIARMRFSISDDNLEELDKITVRLERQISRLGEMYEA